VPDAWLCDTGSPLVVRGEVDVHGGSRRRSVAHGRTRDGAAEDATPRNGRADPRSGLCRLNALLRHRPHGGDAQAWYHWGVAVPAAFLVVDGEIVGEWRGKVDMDDARERIDEGTREG